MYCLICEPLVKLEETYDDFDEGVFFQYYICPECKTEYCCSSMSEDMIQEYLDIVDENTLGVVNVIVEKQSRWKCNFM